MKLGWGWHYVHSNTKIAKSLLSNAWHTDRLYPQESRSSKKKKKVVHWDYLTINDKHTVYQLPPDTPCRQQISTCQSQLWWMRQHDRYGNCQAISLLPGLENTADWWLGTVRLWVWWWVHSQTLVHVTLVSLFQCRFWWKLISPALSAYCQDSNYKEAKGDLPPNFSK